MAESASMTEGSSFSTAPRAATSLWAKLLNLFVSPGEVFEEVFDSPHQVRNWLVPIVLVCLSNLVLLWASADPEQVAKGVNALSHRESLSAVGTRNVQNQWYWVSVLSTCAGAWIGTFWSAFVLWIIGRFLLKARVEFMKAVEVVGLAGIILALGAITTCLLIGASGNPSARPALSLCFRGLPPEGGVAGLLNVFNVFYIWVVGVLAIGLSRLSRVSVKEAGFWVFGYWFGTRLALLLLV